MSAAYSNDKNLLTKQRGELAGSLGRAVCVLHVCIGACSGNIPHVNCFGGRTGTGARMRECIDIVLSNCKHRSQ
eukprot:1159325-Pelagomonas_calceolata.AAC.2